MSPHFKEVDFMKKNCNYHADTQNSMNYDLINKGLNNMLSIIYDLERFRLSKKIKSYIDDIEDEIYNLKNNL